MLEDKLSNEFNSKHTFSPKTNLNKTDLNFSGFIERQKKHSDQVQGKIKNLKTTIEAKSKVSKNLGISDVIHF